MTIESAIQALRRVGQLTVEGGAICLTRPRQKPIGRLTCCASISLRRWLC